ncbi:MAG: hypothetical protein R3192_12515 [Woeseiaceae bacterium]|nr:hypothetical protein [Woeseiaceae bacterium]
MRTLARRLSVLVLISLAACAPSTQSLVEQAQQTGDWSLVDKRFDAIDRRAAQSEQYCPPRTTQVCTREVRLKRCDCVSKAAVRARLRALRPQ